MELKDRNFEIQKDNYKKIEQITKNENQLKQEIAGLQSDIVQLNQKISDMGNPEYGDEGMRNLEKNATEIQFIIQQHEKYQNDIEMLLQHQVTGLGEAVIVSNHEYLSKPQEMRQKYKLNQVRDLNTYILQCDHPFTQYLTIEPLFSKEFAQMTGQECSQILLEFWNHLIQNQNQIIENNMAENLIQYLIITEDQETFDIAQKINGICQYLEIQDIYSQKSYKQIKNEEINNNLDNNLDQDNENDNNKVKIKISDYKKVQDSDNFNQIEDIKKFFRHLLGVQSKQFFNQSQLQKMFELFGLLTGNKNPQQYGVSNLLLLKQDYTNKIEDYVQKNYFEGKKAQIYTIKNVISQIERPIRIVDILSAVIEELFYYESKQQKLIFQKYWDHSDNKLESRFNLKDLTEICQQFDINPHQFLKLLLEKYWEYNKSYKQKQSRKEREMNKNKETMVSDEAFRHIFLQTLNNITMIKVLSYPSVQQQSQSKNNNNSNINNSNGKQNIQQMNTLPMNTFSHSNSSLQIQPQQSIYEKKKSTFLNEQGSSDNQDFIPKSPTKKKSQFINNKK